MENVGTQAISSKRRQPGLRARRWIPWSGAALLLAFVAYGLWPKPVPVETVRAATGPLRATVNEEGKTRIRQRYLVSAPVTGQLRRIGYKAGAEMRAGETIVAVIDPLPPSMLDARARALAEARRDVAAANVEKARVTLSFAHSELRRFEKLHAEKTISPQELESVQLRASAAGKDLAAAESALRQAEAELAEFSRPPEQSAESTPREIKAPVSGRVLRVFEESARVVMAGTPLVELGDPTDLEVVIEVLSRDGAAIPPGAKVEFHQWGGPEPLRGRVRLVEPAGFTKISALGVEEQRVNVVADFVSPPEQRATVGDQFRVDAEVVIWEAQDVLKVPVGALFRRGSEWAAFVLENGRAQFRRVVAGQSSGTETAVLEGLKPGEELIVYPGARVRDGSSVRAIQVSN